MPEIKLKPCPFCGNTNPIIQRRYVAQSKSIYAVQCGKCYARMVFLDRKYKAIEAWNRRAEDLIEMPCKVGDKVYVCYESPYGVLETTIDKIIIHKEFTQVVFTNRSEFTVWDNDWSTYKKSVFFTRDEAERALEEH